MAKASPPKDASGTAAHMNIGSIAKLGVVGLVAVGTGCSGVPNIAPSLPDAPKPADAFGGAACTAGKPPVEPDLIGWDPASRANLSRLRAAGVVAVRYTGKGCNVELELLSNCIGKGSYKYQPYAESQSKTMKSEREVYAELPVGAASLSSNLKGNRALRTDYMLVGSASLPPGAAYKRGDLKGAECSRATHVISAVYLGGFAMVAGSESELGAQVSVFGRGGGAKEGSSMERVDKAGDPEGCEEAKKAGVETSKCAVPLRIGLLPLDEVSAAAAKASGCPEGMVKVEGGSYKLGERGDSATVSTFCMDADEVTADNYAACVKDGKCSSEHLGDVSLDGKTFTKNAACNLGVTGRGEHPINCIDWGQAAAYCGVSGNRLPTEEEWEWAARGGAKGTAYPWGNGDPDVQACWSGMTKRTGTCAVGSSPAGTSPTGIHDLAGNVWEWTQGKVDDKRVRRGGGWYDSTASNLRAVKRATSTPWDRYDSLGMRCARDFR